jgi:magnesium-protoporphyrin O-methyltransferase
MGCCGACDGYASPIDEGVVAADRERYRSDGPDRTTRLLLDMIGSHATPGVTLLDVGGGIGVIGLELLKSVASRVVLVEASPAYVEAARAEADRAGVAERLDAKAADLVRHADEIAEADVVTLDRVVCCYPDARALVSASVARARSLYGLVLPKDAWFVRLAVRLENVRWWLRRSGYRARAHPHAPIDALLAEHGFGPRAEAFTSLWRVVLFGRETSPGGS